MNKLAQTSLLSITLLALLSGCSVLNGSANISKSVVILPDIQNNAPNTVTYNFTDIAPNTDLATLNGHILTFTALQNNVLILREQYGWFIVYKPLINYTATYITDYTSGTNYIINFSNVSLINGLASFNMAVSIRPN